MKTVTAPRTNGLAAIALALTFAQAFAASAASAESATAAGPSALALAAVVASRSSVLSPFDKRAMARLFAGNSNMSFPPTKKISVTADSVVCRVSNVDIAARSCDLTFGGGKRSLTGRDANELFATLAVAGVAAEGALGSMIESMTKLVCTIDPNVVKEKAGGGADCTFTTGE